MELNLKDIYELFGVFSTFLFSFFIILAKGKERVGNIYIGLFVLIIGFGYLDPFLSRINFYNDHPYLWFILPQSYFLFYPTMYLYIRSVAFKKIKLIKYDYLHFLLFVIICILAISFYHIHPIEDKQMILDNNLAPGPKWYIPMTYVVLRIQSVVYLVISLILVLKFKKVILENYSSTLKRNYKWILQLTFIYVYYILMAFFDNIVRFFIEDNISDTILYIQITINILFLIWIVYKVLSQPYLFNGVDSNAKLLKELINPETDIKKNNQTNSEINEEELILKKNLESYMSEEEPYLNPSLSIFDIADELNLPVKEISIFINKQLNKHFFDFVNEYRINKAKELLSNSVNIKLTILEILYEVGFNSKSSFNTAFKKQVGVTPTDYRKKHLKSRN